MGKGLPMKTKALCLVGLFVAAGCSNSGGKGGFDASNPETYKQVQDLTIKNIKQFEAKEDAQLDSDYKNEVYTHGCESQGSYKESYKLDPALRVGDTVYKEMQKNTQKLNSIVQYKTQIQDVSGNTKVESNSVMSMLIKQAGGEVLKKPIVSTMTCKGVNVTKDPSGTTYYSEDCKGDFPQEKDASTYMTPQGVRYWNSTGSTNSFDCVVNSRNLDTQKVERGTFEIDGKKIKAFRHMSRMVGDVVCSGRYVGKGVEERVNISSNEIISQGYTFCGGETLAYSSTISLGEKAIESFKMEIQSATVR